MRPIVWWTTINKHPPSFKRVSRNSRQPPSRLVASVFQPPLSHGDGQVSTHLKRIEAVEKDLKALSETTVAKDDFTKLRAEVKKLYDGLHIGLPPRLLTNRLKPADITCEEFLDLRSHVWGIRGSSLSPTTDHQLIVPAPYCRTRSTSTFEKRAKFCSASLIEIYPGCPSRPSFLSEDSDFYVCSCRSRQQSACCCDNHYLGTRAELQALGPGDPPLPTRTRCTLCRAVPPLSLYPFNFSHSQACSVLALVSSAL